MELFNYKEKDNISINGIEDVIGYISSYLSFFNDDNEKINVINEIRKAIHDQSPMRHEPIDFVEWVDCSGVAANDYNPNKVAPPEMELLRHSIRHDGYTQPVVTWKDEEKREVVDGFHRTRVCKECADINARVKGFLPVVTLREDCADKKDRIASTIRHNRARGKHQVTAMSDIILELKNRNWKNTRIAKELGMDEEEILRLCQITGLQDLFTDDDFSKAWVADDSEEEFEELTDNFEFDKNIRTVNTNDPERIFHTFDKWECAKAGFYASKVEGKKKEELEQDYYDILTDYNKFANALERVIGEWKNSCEHYLTNKAMNRIAWLGQAAVCISTGTPSKFCSGWNLLNDDQQDKANDIALEYLNKWMKNNNRDEVEMDEALSIGRQVEIY